MLSICGNTSMKSVEVTSPTVVSKNVLSRQDFA